MMNGTFVFRIGIIALLAVCTLQGQVERWDVVEIDFHASEGVAAPFEVEFGAVFEKEGQPSMRVPGFYDGSHLWRLRFSPPSEGEWSYRTYSSVASLAGQEGKVEVASNTKEWQRGPIRVSEKNRQRFEYADGTPYFLMAFELDWLFALDGENPNGIPKSRRIIDTVADHGFNQIVMNVFAYDATWGEKEKIDPENNYAKPRVFPFGGTNEDPDFSTLDVGYFQRLDRVVEYLNRKEIAAHLMIYVWNKQVSWPEPESAADNRYFDYVVKRYQAYPNLIWDISKEALAYGRDDMGYITRRIHRLRALDGHRRLVSVHDYDYCSEYPGEVDFISIQEWQPYLYDAMRRVKAEHPLKPIYNIEHGGYEKTMHSVFDGAYTDPIICLDRFYQCVFAGTYSTYYWQNTAWYNVVTEPFDLPEEQQPHFRYYRNLAALFDRFDFNELEPVQHAFSAPMLSNGKDRYLFYVPQERNGIFGTLKEMEHKAFSVEWFDVLSGESIDAGTREFGKGAWVGIKRPEGFGEGIAVVVLEEIDN